jgi:hypothetical protein
LERAEHLNEASKEIQQLINEETIKNIVSLIPEDWLIDESISFTPSELRSAYIEFLCNRLNKIDELTKEALDAR